jgi:tetratricopeptide (TPR) repeat protein
VAQHISRKELKHDEFREQVSHGAAVVASHQQQVWLYGAILVVILGGFFGYRYYMQRQSARASVELADAMKIYDARIRAANEPAQPGELTYVDEKNKYTDAAQKFAQVAGRYPRTQPGRVAQYYDALTLEQLERYAEAEKDFKELASGSDDSFKALASYQLAQVYDKTGRAAQAVQEYQELVNKPTVFVPKPVALLALADHYSQSDIPQATKYYQQVKSEFPDTQAAQLADQRLQLLTPAKS